MLMICASTSFIGTWPGPSIMHCTPYSRPRLASAPEGHDFFPLGGVARVASRAGAQAVAERQGHVVLAGQFEQAVIPCQQRVFLVVLEHPAGEDRTAARHDAKARSPRAAHSAPRRVRPQCRVMKSTPCSACISTSANSSSGSMSAGSRSLVSVALRHRVQRHRAEWQRRAREHIPCGSPRDRRQWTDP